jgi:outer membrane lipoprotein-sorting protein
MDQHARKNLAMTIRLLFTCIMLVVLAAVGSHAQTAVDAGLDQVLRQMESVGKTFVNFKAHFTQKKYTAVLKEFDVPDSGDFYYARAKDGSALLRQEVTKPGRRILTIKGGTAIIYQPGLNQASVANLGRNKDKAEYLALGLGQSPGKLRESFDVKYQGTENVAGAPCSILILKPRNPSAAAYFSLITLWIKKSSGVPIQQKLQEPNGDYLLVDFTEEKLNTSISASLFEQQLPKGVEILKLQ